VSETAAETTPPLSPRDPADVRVERIVSALLRGGVLASLALVVLGTIVSFAHGPSWGRAMEDLRQVRAVDAPRAPASVGAVWDGLRQGHGRAIVTLGLVLLIATPVLRVVVSMITFAALRDWAFVALTGAVLALLAVSFVLGAR
jgi:uncharacterized membrane protein